MTYIVQQKRSDTAHKRPLPTELLDGQLGVNFDTATSGLFFKNDTGGIIKVGPTAIGASAPSPLEQGSDQLGVGELWLDTTDTTNNILKVWNGENWLNVGDGSGDDPGPQPGTGLWELTQQNVIQPESQGANVYTQGSFHLGGTAYTAAAIQMNGSSGNITTIGNVTTSDLIMSNLHKEGGNEVDGTRGHWAFQEGADDLYLINRVSGKKYAFELREVG